VTRILFAPRLQGFGFINFDRDMRDPKSREWARCRNSNLNEDLGKVGRLSAWLSAQPALPVSTTCLQCFPLHAIKARLPASQSV
jgi:hypothetical protein